MYKALTLFLLMAVTASGQLPHAPPPVIRQFKVHYICQGRKDDPRDILVDADSADDARAIIENIIPCVVIMKVTEILLYQERSLKDFPRERGVGYRQGGP